MLTSVIILPTRIKDKVNHEKKEKEEGVEEGKVLKQQFDTYWATKNVIEQKQREKKVALRDFYKTETQKKKVSGYILSKSEPSRQNR